MESLLKIKEFSKIANVSVRTLQYYDEINLLTPAYINELGHRFYNQQSFEALFVISTLKAIGFKLEEIKLYLNDSDFDLEHFIQKEKAKTLAEISQLQGKYMALNSVEFHKNRVFIPPISSHIKTSEIALPNNFDALFLDWSNFIEQLNQANTTSSLTKNDLTKKIADFWNNHVLTVMKDNQIAINETENYYSNMSSLMNTYGLTKDNYQTLKKY